MADRSHSQGRNSDTLQQHVLEKRTDTGSDCANKCEQKPFAQHKHEASHERVGSWLNILSMYELGKSNNDIDPSTSKILHELNRANRLRLTNENSSQVSKKRDKDAKKHLVGAGAWAPAKDCKEGERNGRGGYD